MNKWKTGVLLGAVVSGMALCAGEGTGEPWKMFDRRIGMIVHWGIYSVGGYHEQERMRLYVPCAEYAKYAERFTAERFSAALTPTGTRTNPSSSDWISRDSPECPNERGCC